MLFHLFSLRTYRSLYILAFLLAFTVGCGDEELAQEDGVECSGHGHLHGTHCHCDPGFTSDAEGTACIEEEENLGGRTTTPGEVDPGEVDPGEVDPGEVDPGEVDPGEVEEVSFEPSEVRALVGQADDGSSIWILEAVDASRILRVELYESFGGPTSAGEFPITEAETSYATCGTCVMFQTECVQDGGQIQCGRTYMPQAQGEVVLSALEADAEGDIAGELHDLIFREVTIAQDFSTRDVDGGDMFKLASMSFDQTLEDLQGESSECGGHGHLHGDQCHCNAGYVLDPNDASMCIPE